MKEQKKENPRLRAAPSPTGYVHIGNLRTFLYNYLYVKQNEGKYILRIEDTDQKRKVEGGIEAIIDVLELYGIKFDEGPTQGGDFGPYVQTERADLYQKYADELIGKEYAYRCFCSPQRLEEMRSEQQSKGLPSGYDRKCMEISSEESESRAKSGEKCVIRMKFPEEGETTFTDLVYGEITVPNSSIDDQVLLKSDGIPTYHFAVVVDDHLMGITHVVRGREYLADTPKNIFLYSAFNWEIPEYIHVPHILKPTGPGKLGKRDGALPAYGYLKKGYLPEGILNYIALIGWSPDPKVAKESEIYSIDELIEIFDFSGIQKSGGRYDPKKLDSTVGKHIRMLPTDKLAESVIKWAEDIVLGGEVVSEENEVEEWEVTLTNEIRENLPHWKEDNDYFIRSLELVKERMIYFGELPGLLEFFYSKELTWSEDDWNFKKRKPSEIAAGLEALLPKLDTVYSEGQLPDHEEWEKIVRNCADDIDWKHGEMFMALRSTVTGKTQSPPLFESIEVLGWEQSRKNVSDAIEWLEQSG